MKHAFLFLTLTLTAAVHADAMSAIEAFKDGNYEQARTLGLHEATAEGYTVACRSSLVIAGYYKQDKSATTELHRALSECIKALDVDPGYFEANISFAIALSFEGKRKRKTFYPKAARTLLEKMIVTHPENPLGYGALGAWHSQVSSAGLFARLALKASRKDAKAFFELSLEKGPVDFPLKVEQLKYLAVGTDDEQKQAVILANELGAEALNNSFELLLQKHAMNILAALNTGEKKTIKEAVKQATAFYNAKDWDEPNAYPKDKIPAAFLP